MMNWEIAKTLTFMVVCCTTVCGQTPFSENPNRIDQSNPQIDPANRQLDPANQQFDPANRQFDPANRQFDSANRQFDPANRQFDPANRQFDQNNPQGPFNNPNTDIYGNDPNYPRNDPYGPTQRPYWRDNEIDQYAPDQYPTEIREATYFIVASRMVRPGQLYRVAVTVLKVKQPLTVRASIQRNGVEMSTDHKDIKEGIPETLLMKVPTTSVPGKYKLRVEGLYQNVFGGSAFVNETDLAFSQRSMTIFIQTDKPIYKQNQIVRFRAVPINTELKAFDGAIDVFMLDPNRHIMKRWLSRQSTLGTVSLEYELSDQPVFGEWAIQVIAQGQVEEATFTVEEYYQTRFEVNVTMPAFFFTNEEYIHGIVMANYTSGAPVRGNLTLKAIIRPIKKLRYEDFHRHRQRQHEHQQNYQNYQPEPYNPSYPNYPSDNPNYNPGYNPTYQSYNPNYPNYNDYDTPGGSYGNRPIVEKYFNFDEAYPFWFKIPEHYYEPIPHLKFFYGVYSFKYPIRELLNYIPTLDGMEITVQATVGDRFLDEVIDGYSVARVFNSSIKLAFLGDSPQVFKPGMPLKIYVAASFHDGSTLPERRLLNSQLELRTSLQMRSGGARDLETKVLKMSENLGVWEYKLDMKTELQLEGPHATEQLNDIVEIKFQAYLMDSEGERAETNLLMLAHYSPGFKQIKITTSTEQARLGEYIIFHIRSNYYVERYNYLVISKGIVLLVGDEVMEGSIATMAIPLSADMAPVATICVWSVGKYGEVTADSLTFPVNGISRNKFTVMINNKKAKTGHKVEIAVYGEPGAHVAISAMDKAYYNMQAGNELTYAKVITKMATFDEQTNGTLTHTWSSHEGNPDELVYFPSSTFGIDANRTFEYIGLVVFTDVEVPRRYSRCNMTYGFAECLSGDCYRLDKKCDGYFDCSDGTDESGCKKDDSFDLMMYRKNRLNRNLRLYENVWLWIDCNIGPHGKCIFNVDVPIRPVHWMVSAFSVSPSTGFGMLTKAIDYVSVLPFYINVEMPKESMQGEQVGIRVSVFNYMTNNLEAIVGLVGSNDYKFVHVEEDGIVRAYNPRTSFGEHQFFIFIKAQDVAVVYIPIVPTRLGDMDITVYASSLIGKDQVTKTLHVEADGVPQYRHQSVLLDLSNRAYAFQYMHVNVTEVPIIPYEFDRYYVYGSNRARVSVVGDVVGPIFPTMPVNATSLLHLPMDSAEQNIFSFAANMYTTLYMRYVIQRNKTLERQSFYHMNVLYQRQLSFMQPEGSFSYFRSDWNQSASSVWLTSLCVRVLQEANFYEWENFIYIDPGVVAKSVEWVLRYQTHEGSFSESSWLGNRKYNQSSKWPDNDPIQLRNITLTAHVLIMLESVKDLSSGLSTKVSVAQLRAIQWLERNMKLLNDFGRPFEVALVSYALMKTKAANAEAAFNILLHHVRSEGGLMYWGRERVPQPPSKLENQKPFLLPRLPYEYDSENIETTAYALLVCVARQEIYVDAIVRWLNTQRLTTGGWASTTDTANAMKALIEYTSAQRIRDISSLSVDIEATALPGKTRILHVNDKNRGQLQYVDIPEAWGTVKVAARGTGYAILQMHVQYNVDIARFQTQPPVKAFDLWTRAEYYGRNHSHISYISCQRWTNYNESERSGLTVLDVTIPTGYIIQQQRLDAYVLSRKVRNLQRAKFFDRKVLFYFEYLDDYETCINFTVERWYPVANMSRFLPIRVYDYYAPERFNETIFDALTTYLLNICEVCGSVQCPYCPIYNAALILPVPALLILITSFILITKHLRLQDYFI